MFYQAKNYSITSVFINALLLGMQCFFELHICHTEISISQSYALTAVISRTLLHEYSFGRDLFSKNILVKNFNLVRAYLHSYVGWLYVFFIARNLI